MILFVAINIGIKNIRSFALSFETEGAFTTVRFVLVCDVSMSQAANMLPICNVQGRHRHSPRTRTTLDHHITAAGRCCCRRVLFCQIKEDLGLTGLTPYSTPEVEASQTICDKVTELAYFIIAYYFYNYLDYIIHSLYLDSFFCCNIDCQ